MIGQHLEHYTTRNSVCPTLASHAWERAHISDVCTCACARVRVCMRMCICVCVCVGSFAYASGGHTLTSSIFLSGDRLCHCMWSSLIQLVWIASKPQSGVSPHPQHWDSRHMVLCPGAGIWTQVPRLACQALSQWGIFLLKSAHFKVRIYSVIKRMFKFLLLC